MKLREVAFRELSDTNVVETVPYEPGLSDEWDEFVRQSNNGTIFHTRRFLSYHPEDRFEDCSLLFRKKDKLFSVLPAVLKRGSRGKWMISHAGSSMGGPVFDTGTSIKDTFFLVERLLEFARRRDISTVQITLPPVIYSRRPGNYFDFALLDAGFTYLKREVSSVIPLDFAEEDTLLAFSPESRRAARKALKRGVKVVESEDFSGFYAICRATSRCGMTSARRTRWKN